MASTVTARDLELLGMPSIASQLPIEFANGAQWTTLTGTCSGCGQALPDDHFRGLVHPYEHLASVEAVGVCPRCQLLTRFVYRLHDDMRITGPRAQGWQTWGGPRTVGQKILKYLGL